MTTPTSAITTGCGCNARGAVSTGFVTTVSLRYRRGGAPHARPPRDRLRAADAVRGRQPDRAGERRAVRAAVRRAATGPRGAGGRRPHGDGADGGGREAGRHLLRRHDP